jgi:hypothetical protein
MEALTPEEVEARANAPLHLEGFDEGAAMEAIRAGRMPEAIVVLNHGTQEKMRITFSPRIKDGKVLPPLQGDIRGVFRVHQP